MKHSGMKGESESTPQLEAEVEAGGLVAEENDPFLAHLEGGGAKFSAAQRKELLKAIKAIRGYVPKVGILGKTGVGKSSLCNALFGKEVAEISDVAACTREPQEVLFSLSQKGEGGLILVDVPGLGESKERDKEYIDLYKKLLPELDLILWVLKGDDRAHSIDMDFFNNYVKTQVDACPVVLVVNQVDKIKPTREWDYDKHEPSRAQLENIAEKVKAVAAEFSMKLDDVCAVSADERFDLVGLVERIVKVLPNEKKFAFVRETKEENVSEESKKEVKRGIAEFLEKSVTRAIHRILRE